MRKGKRHKDKPLTDTIREYFSEEVKQQKSSLREVACAYIYLVGTGDTNEPVPYLKFLYLSGVKKPVTRRNFQRTWVGRYTEFLLQHRGTEATDNAAKVLSKFWIWCKSKKYVAGDIPADLKVRPIQPYLLDIMIRPNPVERTL